MRTRDRRRLAIAAAAALGFALAAGAAAACGVCVEDRIAPVYDHAAVRAERERGRTVVFVGIADARGRPARAAAARVRRALAACAGVEPRSVRVSDEAAAAAFAFDPGRERLAGLLARLGRALAPHGLRLDTLRVVHRAATPASAGGQVVRSTAR